MTQSKAHDILTDTSLTPAARKAALTTEAARLREIADALASIGDRDADAFADQADEALALRDGLGANY